MSIRYYGGSTPGSEREIRPISLFRKEGYSYTVYLEAYCFARESNRTFRVERIELPDEELEELEEIEELEDYEEFEADRQPVVERPTHTHASPVRRVSGQQQRSGCAIVLCMTFALLVLLIHWSAP